MTAKAPTGPIAEGEKPPPAVLIAVLIAALIATRFARAAGRKARGPPVIAAEAGEPGVAAAKGRT
ncbi:MAG: hypothetical protein AAF360_15495 [Pseudomonadota bacterium]